MRPFLLCGRKMNKERYFDWAATSPPDIDIITSANEEAALAWANPSSAHNMGKAARKLLEGARNEIALNLDVPNSTIYFTSGGTESNQIVLLSELMRPQKGTVLVSAIEHPAIRVQAKALSRCGMNVVTIPPNKDGIITAENVMKCLTADTTLVCVMAVNNETGAIAPIDEIAKALHTVKGRRIRLHTDCVQALCKVPLALDETDSAAFSAHKVSGPRGIGALYLSKTSHIEPFLQGGGQEHGVRSGTENTAGAVAFAKCISRYCMNQGSQAHKRYLEQVLLTNRFIKSLAPLPNCRIIPEARAEASYSAAEEESKWSPWIVQAAFIGIPGQVMLRALDAMGYCISTGSACSSKKGERPVLDAMGIKKEVSECAVRFSFGHSTTADDMDGLASAVQEIVSRFG